MRPALKVVLVLSCALTAYLQWLWYDNTYLVSRNALERLLGAPPAGLKLIDSQWSLDTQVWNYRVPANGIPLLQARCNTPDDLIQLPMPVIREVSAGEGESADEGSTSSTQQDPPSGCRVADWQSKHGGVFLNATLGGDILQLVRRVAIL